MIRCLSPLTRLSRRILPCVFLLWSVLQTTSAINNNTFDFTIVFHSNLQAGVAPAQLTKKACDTTPNGQNCLIEGGYALAKTTVTNIKLDRDPKPILNLNVNNALATKLFTRLFRGTAEKLLLQDLGVVATGLGNQEMLNNITTLAVNFYEDATFQGLSSNMMARYDHPLSQSIKPYYIFSFTSNSTPIKVGVMSLTSEDVCSRTFYCTQNDEELVRFKPIKSTVISMVETLQFHEEVDIIIALSGLDDLSQDIALLQSVDGIDILLSSDSLTNSSLPTGLNAYPVRVSTPSGRVALAANLLGKNGVYTGLLDVSYVNGVLDTVTGGPIHNINSTVDSQPDPVMKDNVTQYLSQLAAFSQIDVGYTATPLVPFSTCVTNGLNNECVSANVLADAILSGMAGSCDHVLVNAGLISAPINGSIKVADIYGMFPFENKVTNFEIQGRYLVDALNNGVSRAGEQKGGRFPAVGNIRFSFDLSKKTTLVNPAYTDYPNWDFRVTKVLMKKNGTEEYEPIQLDKDYRMCSIDYISQGGDGYLLNKYARNMYLNGPQLDEVYQKYVEKNSPLSPAPDGRVTIEPYPLTGAITGTCKYPTITLNSETGVYEDICGGGVRAVSNFTWVVSPKKTGDIVRAVTLFFEEEFKLEASGTDKVTLTETGKSTPLLVRINGTDIPAVFTGDTNPLPTTNLTFFASGINIAYEATSIKSGSGLKVSFWGSTSCPVGYVDVTINKLPSCSPCSAGTYGEHGSCHLCLPGTYADKVASIACTECEGDYFTKDSGSQQCELCDNGRHRVSSTECNCPAGFYYNGFSCLDGRGSSDSAIVAGIAAVVLVCFGGLGYYYYRRRMRLIQARATKNTKTTNIRVGIKSMAFIVDTGSTIVWILLEVLEVVFDWLAFVNIPSGAGVAKFVYVGVVIIGCIGSMISLGIRIYFLHNFFQLHFHGITFIEKKKSTKTSKTSVNDDNESKHDNDSKLRELHDSEAFRDAMMNIRLARRKLSLTQFVAIPGILKGIPVMVTEIYLFTLLGSQGNSVGILLVSFVFTTAMLALNMSEVSHWPEARKSVRDCKATADAILQNANIARASAYHLAAPSTSGIKLDSDAPPVPKIASIYASGHLGDDELGRPATTSDQSLSSTPAPAKQTSPAGIKSPASLEKSQAKPAKNSSAQEGAAGHPDNTI